MATPQLSPGVQIREIDQTVGRADNVLANVGAIAGPFPIGPVDFPVDIATEQDLINVFGKPSQTDGQYEYWMSASSYLSYGGVLKVVRTSGNSLNNSNAGVGTASSNSAKIKNYDDYLNNWSTATNFTFAAKNPGSWADELKVCMIDDLADQIIGIATTNPTNVGAQVGYGVTAAVSTTLAGTGVTSTFNGYLKGIITGVNADTVNGNSNILVKIVSRVSSTGEETPVDYAEGYEGAAYMQGSTLSFVNNSGIGTGTGAAAASVNDWYNQQTLGLTNSTIYWKSIAPKPVSTRYVLDRNGKNDGINIVVVDDLGKISGVQGAILEKHVGLSKAIDCISAVNSPQKIWYKQYLADFSTKVYAGINPSESSDAYWGTTPTATGFSTNFTPTSTNNWGDVAQSTVFSSIGNVTYNLTGGADYGMDGGLMAELGDLVNSYELFSNADSIAADYLIMGPGLGSKSDSQAKANALISIADQRKDCIATISPYRYDVVNVVNSTDQTNNIISFFSSLAS